MKLLSRLFCFFSLTTAFVHAASLDTATIEQITGVKGLANNGMFKVVIGRTTKMPCGCEMTKDLGVNTWAAFAGSDDNIAATVVFAQPKGDIAVTLSAKTVTFDSAEAGKPPAGWTATKTGSGEAKWSVVADDSAPSKPNVLKQSGEATYPVCIKDDTSVKDGFVEVKFKPVAGKEDQAGGVIWRCRDADNYYIARANALEDNVTIYHTIKGKRVSFKSVNTKVSSGEWHALRVDFEDNNFTVAFDGKKVIEATDNSFKDAGKVGVWTKADSVTLFDDFTYSSK